MDPRAAGLDPFRVIVGWIEARGDSDLLRRVANSAGLVFDPQVDETTDDNYSSNTRARAQVRWVRTLSPRILQAYEAKDQEARLHVARAAMAVLGSPPELVEGLARVGWGVQGGDLVVADPGLIEVFFPKGSQWDAFVVLRGIFGEATAELMVVDGYADGTVFEILAPRQAPLALRVLCSQYAVQVAAEARRFCAQFPGVTCEVRRGVGEFHDRFVVLDHARCIHIGASINHAGRTAFMISRVEDDSNRLSLLGSIESAWNAATPVP